MATDHMYELAFAYKKTKLWKYLLDREVFAVRFPDGETGYCSVMGLLGEHIALGVYPGAHGYDTFRRLAFDDPDADTMNPLRMLSQNCLQCSFESKDYLRDGEQEEVRAYTRAHKISLRGPHSYPQFTRYEPYRFPWYFRDEIDNIRITAALEGAIGLFDLLQSHSKDEIGLVSVEEDSTTVPLIFRDGDHFTFTPVPLPPPMDPVYPTPTELSEETAQSIRKLKKKGIMECELLRLQQPVMGNDGGAPWFPVLLLCADSREGYLLPVPPADHYDENPDTLLEHFLDALRNDGTCPRAMKVRNTMTLALLEDFCMKTGVLLTVDPDLPSLDRMREHFLQFLSDQDDDDDDDYDEYDDDDDDGYEVNQVDMDEMFEQIMALSDGELRSLPKEFVNQLLAMAGFGVVPDPLLQRLRRIFHR